MDKGTSADLVRMLLEHRDGLIGFALALTHDRDAAEEVFQEVGLAVVQEAGKGAVVAKFLPWAHEMIRRRVAEHWRKTSRSRSESLDEAVSQAFQDNPLDAGLHGRRQDHLADCLDGLSPVQKRMIEGRYRDRAPLREIARGIDWSEGAVKVALWKARRQLARCIEGKLGGEK